MHYHARRHGPLRTILHRTADARASRRYPLSQTPSVGCAKREPGTGPGATRPRPCGVHAARSFAPILSFTMPPMAIGVSTRRVKPFVEQRQDGSLLRVEVVKMLRQLLAGALLDRRDGVAV